MKGKFMIFYDWHWREETPCEASAALSHGRVISSQGKTFEEAREKLVEELKAIPEDEPVKIC